MVSLLDKLLFTKHLSVMIKSGITIAESIEVLSHQTKSDRLKHILDEVSKDIKNGQSLARSLSKHPKAFSDFYISLIDVGEESGTIDKNLDYLAKQLAKDYQLRKKIQGALLYPTIVVSAITIIGIGMSLFVLPKLVELFTSLDVKLPITTKILLYFANLMKNHGVFIIAGFVAAIFLLRILISLSFVRPKWDRITLSFPIFGTLFQNQQLSILCRNLGIMLKSGLPITKALEVEHKASENYVFKDYIEGIQKAVDKGKAIEDELTLGHYSKFSPIAVKMIGVGERTGKLDETFLYLGDFFEEEVDDTTKNLPVVLEPLLLLIIGLMVGFVALAIISPIYELTGAIKR